MSPVWRLKLGVWMWQPVLLIAICLRGEHCTFSPSGLATPSWCRRIFRPNTVYEAGPLGCRVNLVQQVGPDGARAPHYMLKNTWLPPTASSAAGTNASTETESAGTGSQTSTGDED